MLHTLSTLVVLIVTAGLLTRHSPVVHLRLMTTAFLIDLGLVIYIEVARHAVEQVVGPAGRLIWFHALVSTLVLATYAAQITVGRRMFRGRAAPRRLHLILGLTFCVFRSLNYATAFLVSGANPAPALRSRIVAVRPAPPTAAFLYRNE